jgi:hypothetical protein
MANGEESEIRVDSDHDLNLLFSRVLSVLDSTLSNTKHSDVSILALDDIALRLKLWAADNGREDGNSLSDNLDSGTRESLRDRLERLQILVSEQEV